MNRSVEFRVDAAAAYLDSLPMVEPSQLLFAKLLRARSERQRRGKWQVGAGLAAALVLSSSALLIWRGSGLPETAATITVPIGSTDLAISNSSVQRLDDLLAQAYASDASEAQLQSLWDARTRLLAQPNAASLVQL